MKLWVVTKDILQLDKRSPPICPPLRLFICVQLSSLPRIKTIKITFRSTMTVSRRCLFATLSFLSLFVFYFFYKVDKNYQKNKHLCGRQNLITNATCTLFPSHRRRNDFKEIFRRWVTFAEKHNVSYTLACGSLLGQYRDQDMIAWDGDIDVYVDIKHYNHLKRLGQPRNFREASDDVYRFIVQPEFDVRREREPRRWNCNGQVSWWIYIWIYGEIYIYGYIYMDIYIYIEYI